MQAVISATTPDVLWNHFKSRTKTTETRTAPHHLDAVLWTLKRLIKGTTGNADIRLLLICKEITAEIYPTFYSEICLTKRNSLDSLLTTLEATPSRIAWIQTLTLRVGSPESDTCEPTTGSVARPPIQDSDHEHIQQLLSSCRATLSMFILRADRGTPKTCEYIRRHVFRNVKDVDIPLDALMFDLAVGSRGPFPNAVRMRVSVVGDTSALASIDRFDFTPTRYLERILIALSDVSNETMSFILNYLRPPPPVACVGLESNRGSTLPCAIEDLCLCLEQPWLTLVVAPYVAQDVVEGSHQVFPEAYPRCRWVNDVLYNTFTTNACKGDDIWTMMDNQVHKKRKYIESSNRL